MSQTGNYIKVEDVLFKIAAFSGDKDFKAAPKGFYISLISDAFEDLNMDTMLMEGHADFNTADYSNHLNIELPKDCFNVRNIWMYDGDTCHFEPNRKVWHKRNFYSKGHGYLANRTGHNTNDPFYVNNSLTNNNRYNNRDKSLIRYNSPANVNNILFYNIQNGVLMLSESCRAAGNKIHIHYNSTGCDVTEAPIIPRFYKEAIEHRGTEEALLFRMANDPVNARAWQSLQQTFERKSDRYGMNGSWHDAIVKSTTMSSAEKSDLCVYLGRAAWLNGQ